LTPREIIGLLPQDRASYSQQMRAYNSSLITSLIGGVTGRIAQGAGMAFQDMKTLLTTPITDSKNQRKPLRSDLRVDIRRGAQGVLGGLLGQSIINGITPAQRPVSPNLAYWQSLRGGSLDRASAQADARERDRFAAQGAAYRAGNVATNPDKAAWARDVNERNAQRDRDRRYAPPDVRYTNDETVRESWQRAPDTGFNSSMFANTGIPFNGLNVPLVAFTNDTTSWERYMPSILGGLSQEPGPGPGGGTRYGGYGGGGTARQNWRYGAVLWRI
jgi:hypothetical protein